MLKETTSKHGKSYANHKKNPVVKDSSSLLSVYPEAFPCP